LDLLAQGYSRKGTALIFLGDLQEAVATFQKGLSIAPDDAALQKGLKDAIAAGMLVA
jgi:Flp pilus assembly protein TadD